jgi:hypothetical protein
MLLKLSAALLAIFCSTSSYAADNVIRPQCWEENVNGTPERHCEVRRAEQPPPAARPAQRPLYANGAPPPPPPSIRPYTGPASEAPRYWSNGTGPFYPPPGPAYYELPYYAASPPYPYYYGAPCCYGPGFAFGFGPFRFWIP